jgi:hypothetical protein
VDTIDIDIDTRATRATKRDIRATAVGVLLLVATAASLVATACFGSSLTDADFLTSVARNENRMLTGTLFELIAAFSSAAIAVSLYPVLRRHGPAMALGSVAFRVIEGVFYAFAAVSVMVLVTLAGDAAAPASAAVMRDLHDAAALAGIFAFYVGGTLYYIVFYRSRLVPRWLSGWGLVGTSLGAVAAVLVLFRSLELTDGVHTLLNVPIGLQELVLAVWLLRKGFRTAPPAAATPRPARRPSEPAPLLPA